MLMLADFPEVRESWCTKTHVRRRSTCNKESIQLAEQSWRSRSREQAARSRAVSSCNASQLPPFIVVF